MCVSKVLVRIEIKTWRNYCNRKCPAAVGKVLTGLTELWSLSFVVWLVGWLTSRHHASVSQGRICTDNFTCCHTETEVADQTFYLTQLQYTDTGPTSPSADPITPEAPGRVATGVPVFKSLVWLDPQKSRRKRDSNPGSSAPEADALTTRPARRFLWSVLLWRNRSQTILW